MREDSKIEDSFEQLKSYCEKVGYKGWDPYDGLNSKIFQSIPGIRKIRIARLIWIQTFKLLPFNLRRIFIIKKDYNPKGLGLFLNGYCNLYKASGKKEYLEKINFLADMLIKLTSKGYSGASWGYNFDWQARAFFQPKYTPTVVATTFIGNALLDAYDITKNKKYLNISLTISDFILNDLNRTYDDKGNFSFSYSPQDKSQVINATLLGSRMLARLYFYSKNKLLLEEAKKSIDFACAWQNEDGSWPYGTYSFHAWIDNFHTGYNLECMADYEKYSGDKSYEKNIRDGLEYYLNTFFTKEGKSKYYNNSLYPIDIHAPSQLIVTMSKLNVLKKNIDLADRVLNWTINNMQSPGGYFYFQINKHFKVKIPYIRWSQAWMFYAMTEYLKSTGFKEY